MTSKTDAGVYQPQVDDEGFLVFEYETDENGDFIPDPEYPDYFVQKLDEDGEPIKKTKPLKDNQKLTILGLFIASKIISLFPLNFKRPRAFGFVRF